MTDSSPSLAENILIFAGYTGRSPIMDTFKRLRSLPVSHKAWTLLPLISIFTSGRSFLAHLNAKLQNALLGEFPKSSFL